MQEQNRRRVLRARLSIKDGHAVYPHRSMTRRLHKTSSPGLTAITARLALLRADDIIHGKLLAAFPPLRNLCSSLGGQHRRRNASATTLESIQRCAETFGSNVPGRTGRI